MDLEISEKYEPMFRWLNGDFPQVDTIIITGGRYSQKSFATGLFSCLAAKDYNHRILYTRYTLTSAEDSIIPEFSEKVDLLGAHSDFEITRDRIRGIRNDSKIVFKGIKTSAGNQTASLKSLKNFSIFLLEEAEEMPNFDDWDKVKKSIRALDVQNLSILVLNPTTSTHWIFEEFFEGRNVLEGFNGVNGNVMYINTSYLDMDRKYIPDSIYEDFEDKRKAYEEWIKLPIDLQDNSPLKKKAKYYKHVVMGGWLPKAEGVIFENWVTGEFQDTGYTVFGMDFGFSQDPTTLVKVSIDRSQKKIYLKEFLYKTKLSTTDIANELQTHCGFSYKIIADSAEPRLISEIASKGFNMHPAVKGQGSISAGIALMLDYDLIINPNSHNLIKELNNYQWHDKKSKTPVDAHNHLIDAARYAISDLMSAQQAPRGNLGGSMRGIRFR